MDKINYYESGGSPIREVYQMWFNDLTERVIKIMDTNGINYKIRRKRIKRHKSLYAERYYSKI